MENTTKKALKRSNSYPSMTILEAIDLTNIIGRHGGHSFIKLEDIANITQKSAGGMSQKVGTAVQYNLLEMKTGTGYRPSDLFKKIQKPLSADEKQQNMIEAFKSPKLYAELIEKLDHNPIPSEVILTNILERDHSIYDDAARKAATVFLQNIEDLSLRNFHNELQLDKTEDKFEEIQPSVNIIQSYAKTIDSEKYSQAVEQNQNLLKLEIGLTNAKKAMIYYPLDMTLLDIEIIKLQITVLEKIVENNKAGT